MHPVSLDQRRGGLHRLKQRCVGTVAAAGVAAAGTGSSAVIGRSAGAPSTRALEPERGENLVVEAVLALQQLVDPAQERPRLRALDHAVVVGAGHRRDLLHAELLQAVRVDRREPRRVADRTGGHDRALARHQARDRGHRAEPAWIGERHVGALIGVGGERVVARAGDELVVAGREGREVERRRRRGSRAPRATACRRGAPRPRRGRGSGRRARCAAACRPAPHTSGPSPANRPPPARSPRRSGA